MGFLDTGGGQAASQTDLGNATTGASFTVAPSTLIPLTKFWYSLNNTWADSSGNSPTLGTFTGSPTFTTALINKVASFNGSMRAQAAYNAVQYPSGSFTLTAFVKPASTGSGPQIMGLGNEGVSNGCNFAVYGGHVFFRIATAGGSGSYNASSPIVDGAWNFCAVKWDSVNNLIWLKSNGNAWSSSAGPGAGAMVNASGGISFGNVLNGQLAFVGMFSGLLDDAAVAALRNSGSAMDYPYLAYSDGSSVTLNLSSGVTQFKAGLDNDLTVSCSGGTDGGEWGLLLEQVSGSEIALGTNCVWNRATAVTMPVGVGEFLSLTIRKTGSTYVFTGGS